MNRLIVILSILFSGVTNAAETPMEFFNNFVILGEQFNSDVEDLYEDGAEISGSVIYPDGRDKKFVYEGWQWKKSIKKVMPQAKAQNDKSTYSNITITELETGYKIKADRYSVKRCYTDKEYYMVIRPKSNGGFGIIKEHVELRQVPDC